MGLFGKNKEEEFDEEDGFTEEEELQDRKLTRKFRDLKPENKKKRKEPPKPWGKKERTIVLSFFVVTTLLAAVMFFVSHDFKIPDLPLIGLGNFSLKNPFGEEIIEVGQPVDASQNDKKAAEAITLFKQEIKPLAGVYGFTVMRLGDGTGYGVSSDQKFQGASLLKLPLMVLMYKLSEEGKLNLDTKYTLKDSDKVKGSGDLYNQPAGTSYSYRQLAEFMGKDSDRTAYKIMKDVIGDSAFNSFLNQVGMKDTDIDTGDTTPNDIETLLQKLWDLSLVNKKDRNEIFGYLEQTMYEKWITAGVPRSVTVAHKFGQDEGVMADGGIILTAKPYILVIMGNGITQEDADALFPKVSKDVYDVENDVQ